MESSGGAPEKPDRRTVISLDAMGGDSGPAAVVAGMAKSVSKNPDIRFILHGPHSELAPLVARNSAISGKVEVRDSAAVVSMDERPSHVMR
ncbi:MAG: phosphate acyltransferase, partial [Pseudomonadota bacterium]